MRHQCTVCLRAFVDDSGGLPESGRVHCVFCGAAIPQRRKRRAEDRVAAVPFSKDVEREEAFALGIIGAGNVGFPDTLRQFRVKPADSRPSDTFMPVAQGADHGAEPNGIEEDGAPAPWRRASFWASLAVGLVVGVSVASLATSLARKGRAAASASPSPAVVQKIAAAATSTTVAPPPVVPACSAVAPVTPPIVAAVKAPVPKVVDPALERRFLLERARSRQREYRLSDAERLYRQVLTRAPTDSEALAGLGEVDVLRGTTEQADAHFRQALQVNADYIPALIAVADLQWEAGRGREAQRGYREIVERYDADLYPPYVAQRSTALLTPQCGEH
jgi:hypothetical protein